MSASDFPAPVHYAANTIPARNVPSAAKMLAGVGAIPIVYAKAANTAANTTPVCLAKDAKKSSLADAIAALNAVQIV